MPDFRAPTPTPKPLACVIHGNSLACPGQLECSGVIRPAQPAPESIKVQPPAPNAHAVVTLESAAALARTMDDDELEIAHNAFIAELDRRWSQARTKRSDAAPPSKL
jgi:hypothetical protein